MDTNSKAFSHIAVITAATLTGLVLTIPGATALSPTTAANIQQPSHTYAEGNDFMTMKNDQTNRSHDIHWPAGFDPEKADLFSHNQLVINAPCERVWTLIIEAPKWPEWYPNSSHVQISEGGTTLKEGTIFHWTTFGLQLESRVNEFVPDTRIGWFGYAPGTAPTFYHTWYLTPIDDTTCNVIMEEVGNGPAAANMRKTDEGGMHRGHDLWLATLKWMAEKKS
jgi:uncharacterized protein YndB with AHSA1/START domain